MLTERFKNAVKDVVRDGEVTEEEKQLLLKIAKEDRISETDATAYFISEAKKAKAKINGKPAWDYAKDIFSGLGTAITIVAGTIGAVLEILTFFDKRKKS